MLIKNLCFFLKKDIDELRERAFLMIFKLYFSNKLTMKNYLLLALLSALFCPSLQAQDCLASSYFKKNSQLELTVKDPDGKTQSRIEYKVVDVKSVGNDFTAQVKTEMFDKKDKSVGGGEVLYKCDGSEFKMDMRNFVPTQQNQSMKNMEVKAEESYLVFPKKLEVGNTLPDGKFRMETFMNGMKLLNVTLDVTERKVIDKESVTTPTGTYECYKINTKQHMKSGFGMDFETTEWYAPSLGILVKSEMYRKGKLQSVTTLTRLQN